MKKAFWIFAGFVGLMLSAVSAQSAVIYESGTTATGPLTSGLSVDTQFVGSRFSLTDTYTITGFGGTLGTSGSIWGAIVEMSGDMPAFNPLDTESNAIVSALFTSSSADVAEELISSVDTILGPGDYALIFGGDGLFGSTGSGFLPSAISNTAAGTGSYFVGSTTWGGSWDLTENSARFIVEGDVYSSGGSNGGGSNSTVPEPTSLILLGLGLAGLGSVRKRKMI